jgi:Domain of unknown function (DUF1707)
VSQQRDTASAVVDGPARPDVLASDADRDALAGVLSSAFAEGRLTAPEHAERIRAAYGARTMGELAGLTADLPGRGPHAGISDVPVVPGDVDRCLLCALLICCPPAGIAWLLAARRRARASGGTGAADR